MAKWTENMTVKFVEEYLRHEVLWNFRNPSYRNKQAKQKAMHEIVAAMDVPDFGYKEVDLKIKSIRSTYSQEIKKIKNTNRSGSGTDDVYKSNLKWFYMLHEALKSINIAELKTTQNNWENIQENCGEQNTESNSSELNEGNVEENSREITKEDDVTSTPTAPARKRKLRDLNLLVDKLESVNKVVNAPKSTEHEFDLFGKSVAGQLKAMTLIQALEAQQYIQNYLSQMRIKQLTNNFRTSSPMQQNTPYLYTPSPSTSTYRASSPSPITPNPTDNYIYEPPTPMDNYINQTPTPTDHSYLNQAPTHRPPTPQNTITIQDDNDDILSQALASISKQ